MVILELVSSTSMAHVRVRVMVFNATFNNSSIVLVEETVIPGEKH